MKRVNQKKSLYLFMLLSLLGCKNKAELDDNRVPRTLLVSYFGGDDPEQSAKKLKAVGLYLEKKLDMKVEFIQTTDYTAVIEALHAKKVHMAHMSPFSYILAAKNGDIEPLVVMGENGRQHNYKSIIVTHQRTGLKTMDDVKKRAKELTLCFSDPASNSGHLIPRAYLTSVGLDPQNSFKQVVFASTNGASVMTVLSGKVDIGCSWENSIPILEGKGILKRGELLVLWTSPPLAGSPIVIRKDINRDFAEKVKQAYLSLSKEDPEVFTAYLKQYYADPKGFGYIPSYDSSYNSLREIARGIKDINMAH